MLRYRTTSVDINPLNRIIDFITLNKNSQLTLNTLFELSSQIKSSLDSMNNNENLLEIFTHFGWSENHGFDSSLNLNGLLIALETYSKKNPSCDEEYKDTSSFVSFTPEFLVCKISNLINSNDSFILKPTSFLFPGALLLVDISGFTKLSNYYCLQGEIGIDKLQSIINAYIGNLVDVIYSYGGDVIKFAGDAILCIFPLDYDLKEAIMRSQSSSVRHASIAMPSNLIDSTVIRNRCISASLCALALAKIENQYELSVHSALSYGEVNFGFLGGFNNQWDFLINSPCLLDLSSCLDDAKSGQVVVSPSMYSILDSSSKKYKLSCELLFTKNYLLKSLDLKNETLNNILELRHYNSSLIFSNSKFRKIIECFIPNFIFNGPILNPNSKDKSFAFDYSTNHLSELREVTTLFIKLDSFDFILNKDVLTLQPHLYTIQKCLNEYGGYLRQFIIDDKGCVLIAMWGVPSFTYIDNSYRAFNAAIYLKQELLSMNMKTSIGVTTGKVFCGTIGSQSRQEYAVIGDSVNMSARLMCHAQDNIYIDVATVESLPFNCVSLLTNIGKIKVKGKADLIEVYKYDNYIFKDDQENIENIKHLNVRQCVKDHFFICLNHLLESPSILDTIKNKFNYFLRKTRMKKSQVQNSILITSSNMNGNSYSSHVGKIIILMIEAAHSIFVTNSVSWLQIESIKNGIKFFNITLSSGNRNNHFYLWKLIFRELIGRDKYDNESVLFLLLPQLLKECYPDDVEGVPKVYLPAICQAFNLNFKTDGFRSIKSAKADLVQKMIPSKLIMEVIQKLITHLLRHGTNIIIVENTHFAPQLSLKILHNLKDYPVNALFVLTAVSDGFVNDNDKKPESTEVNNKQLSKINEYSVSIKSKRGSATLSKIQPLINTALKNIDEDSLHSNFLPWIRRMFENMGNFYSIKLGDYTKEEILSFLTLHYGKKDRLDTLSDLIFMISSGNPFWVEDMFDFIVDSGIETFLKLIDEQKNNDSKSDQSDQDPESISQILTKNSDSSPLTTTSSVNSHGHTTVLKSKKNSTNSNEPQTFTINLKSISSTSSSLGNKLATFILCRYEALSQDHQQILKYASIVGNKFNVHLLYSILPRRFKFTMYNSLSSIKKSGCWISLCVYETDTYTFTHPVLCELLWTLTPNTQRKLVLQNCVEFIENIHLDKAYLSFKHNSTSVLPTSSTTTSDLTPSLSPLTSFSLTSADNFTPSVISFPKSFRSDQSDDETTTDITSSEKSNNTYNYESIFINIELFLDSDLTTLLLTFSDLIDYSYYYDKEKCFHYSLLSLYFIIERPQLINEGTKSKILESAHPRHSHRKLLSFVNLAPYSYFILYYLQICIQTCSSLIHVKQIIYLYRHIDPSSVLDCFLTSFEEEDISTNDETFFCNDNLKEEVISIHSNSLDTIYKIDLLNTPASAKLDGIEPSPQTSPSKITSFFTSIFSSKNNSKKVQAEPLSLSVSSISSMNKQMMKSSSSKKLLSMNNDNNTLFNSLDKIRDILIAKGQFYLEMEKEKKIK